MEKKEKNKIASVRKKQKHTYKGSGKKSSYNPWRWVNKIENKAHANNFKEIYESMIPIVIKQQRQVDSSLQQKTIDYDELYITKNIPLEDGRTITLHIIKIPTFTNKGKPQYYMMFFINIDYYSINDFKLLHALCYNNQGKNTEIEGKHSFGNQGRYTIFLSGKQVGSIHPFQWIKTSRHYHIWKINTITAKKETRSYAEVRQNIFNTLRKLFQAKVDGLRKRVEKGWHYYRDEKMTHHLFGVLKQDYERLQEFIHQLLKTSKYFWKIRYNLETIKKKQQQFKEDEDSMISNNIRKQRNQYLKLRKMIKKQLNSGETNEKRGKTG
ncbi:MAG: hypothetical protein ACOC80_07055 [Petrotogales bacterium]